MYYWNNQITGDVRGRTSRTLEQLKINKKILEGNFKG
jgi:hypothetical protein